MGKLYSTLSKVMFRLIEYKFSVRVSMDDILGEPKSGRTNAVRNLTRVLAEVHSGGEIDNSQRKSLESSLLRVKYF